MVSRPQKIILLKLLSLVSVVRGYAIALMIAAQLFTAAFILSPEAPLSEVLLSGNLWWLILATALSIAGGYIINNFYDQEKDLINRPRRSKLDQMLRQQTKLSGYFILNFASVLAASAVSFQAALFFFWVYIFDVVLFTPTQKNHLYRQFDLSNFVGHAPFYLGGLF